MKILIQEAASDSLDPSVQFECDEQGIHPPRLLRERPDWRSLDEISIGIVVRSRDRLARVLRFESLVAFVREIRRRAGGSSISIECLTSLVDADQLLSRSIPPHEGPSLAPLLRADVGRIRIESNRTGRIFVDGTITNTGLESWFSMLDEVHPIRCGILVLGEKGALIHEDRCALPLDQLIAGRSARVHFECDSSSLPSERVCILVNLVKERLFWFQDVGSAPFVGYIDMNRLRRSFEDGERGASQIAG